ncbi:unnamed protein product [Cochlearia groenlandica]
MTKATIIAIFMIVLAIGMVVQETQGQEMCHDFIKMTECENGECATLCKEKWNGNGSCFQNIEVMSCFCSFPCQN